MLPSTPAERAGLPQRRRALAALASARIANCWLRLGASGVAALVASSLSGDLLPIAWYGGLLPIALIDRALHVRLLRRCEAGDPPPRLLSVQISTLVQSAYGNVLAFMLWFAPYVPGETLAVMYVCGGLANGAASLRSFPAIALCGMGPSILTMLALPLADFLLSGGHNTLLLAPLVGALLLFGFGVNLWRDLLASDAAQAQAEAAVLRERQAAAAAAAAKTDMIRRMNNELRTPMSALIGAAEHLRRAAVSPQARAQIATLVQAGEVLKLVLDDLSDLDRLENGRLPIELKAADPRELVRGVVAAFRATAEDKHIELFLDVAQDMPPAVLIDAARVRQILFNLLANAVRYTTHGGVRVRLSAQPIGADQVRLSVHVADTGVGMSRSQLALVMGRDRLRSEGDGPGLGLAISLKLARLMGGQLTARSELGQGSIFSFAVDAQIAVRGQSAA